jgi:hypothetical protein
MTFPKSFKKSAQRFMIMGLALTSVGLITNAFTYTKLQAMPTAERWCVTSPAPDDTQQYLDAGYVAIPVTDANAHDLPEGSVKRDRNHVFWDAGCLRQG